MKVYQEHRINGQRYAWSQKHKTWLLYHVSSLGACFCGWLPIAKHPQNRPAPTMKKPRPHFKSVQHAYATSPDACRFGYGSTGCYTLNLRTEQNPPQALQGFDTYAEALQEAEKMSEPFDPIHHAKAPQH